MIAFEHYESMDAALVAAGFPATSPWWLATLRSFYNSGKRQLAIRCGRRGGKSSTMCRVAVVEALAGGHVVPPGDLGVVAFVSVSRDEATKRLRTIVAILDALKVKHRPLKEGLGVELVGKPIAFQVFAATIAGVSGPTCITAACDEVAKWRDADTGANPAEEVLASLRPTMATMPGAPMFLVSSPFGSDDAHARAFDQGDTPRQAVAYAPTWIANPTITEADTREAEPDLRVWSREYLAVPQAAALAAFDVEAVDKAFALKVEGDDVEHGDPIVVIDASSGRSDAWTWCVARRVTRTEAGGTVEVIEVSNIDAVSGAFWQQRPLSDVVAQIAKVAKDGGAVLVVGDQREAYALDSEFAKHGLRFVSIPWTNATKVDAVASVRRWLREGVLSLEVSDRMRAELLRFEERITPSGALTFTGRRSGDDHVALLLTLAMAEQAGELPTWMHRPPPSHDAPWWREGSDAGGYTRWPIDQRGF
jgi:hypothetical protein